jgi:SAM-dependent methyltransferase
MRELIKEFALMVSTTLPIVEPIYEFGALQVEGQEGFADLRPLFPGKEYHGCDMRPGLGVNKILDLHAIELESESVGTVLCFDTLEHVEYPHRAMDEIFRVVKPDGIVVISSVFNFAIHDYPYDYWRFTPEAFRSLLKRFNGVYVGGVGKKEDPHTIIGIGFKGNGQIPGQFIQKYNKWEVDWYEQEKISLAKKIKNQLMPPIFRGIQLKKLWKIAK